MGYYTLEIKHALPVTAKPALVSAATLVAVTIGVTGIGVATATIS
ncbi:hypothetical protein [Lysinibacter sp. HNR]|nr:hypothetical protein [Lysinibacter sp. HNR]WGD37512.1 hypothetical protein FrondiHNR_00895 [Lysinibacter sp. HNR]